MTESIRLFWISIGKKKSYWMPLLYFTISMYVFSTFSRTIGVDDLVADYYVGSGHAMIAAGRWGMNLTSILDAIPIISPASDRLFAASFLLMASVLLASMFFYTRPDQKGPIHHS